MDIQHQLKTDAPLLSLPNTEESLSEGHEWLSTCAKRRRPSPTLWRLALLSGDGILLLTALVLLAMLAPLFHLDLHISWGQADSWQKNLTWVCIALLSWSIAASVTQAQELRKASNRFKSPLIALLALILMLACWIILISPFIIDRLNIYTGILIIFLLIAAPLLSIWRIMLADCMNMSRFRPHGVIIGANKAGVTLTHELRQAKRPGVIILGYISESAVTGTHIDGLPMLGGRAALRRLIHEGHIDTIVMATDYRASSDLFQDAIEAAQLGISVVPMSTVYERTVGKIPVEHIGDQWYVSLPSEPGSFTTPLYLLWRKIIDGLAGLCGVLLLLLILPLIALLIRLDSPGPIFYQQERAGYRGKKFTIYKFRSMYTNAEQDGQVLWTTQHDPRITRFGRFMRATHLDELPQVINIVRGEMSLIGPRPEREAFVRELEKTIPFYRCRLMAKPGLTGWAQVKYRYGNTGEDALVKLQYDLYYIKNQSFTLDLFILFKTVFEVIAHRGL